jgi:hypothetical protein
MNQESNIIFYTTPNGQVSIQVQYEDGSFWLTQKRMAELFGVDVRTINEHLQNIYHSKELQKETTIRKIRIVQQEGNREVSRELDFYNLDTIIAVGYRVNSYQATQFRIWATNTLKEFIIKGFVVDDERLKQGKSFGKDYFEELLELLQYPILQDKGKVSALEAKLKAEQEYKTYHKIQDENYISDFDREVKRIQGK